MQVYPATFTKDGKYISVRFPDIPEAMTQGETMDEAFQMAEEVLGFALEDYEKMPDASSFEKVQKENPNSAVSLIPIDMVAYMRKYHSKTIQKTVTVPEYLAVIAKERGINTSQVFTEALERKLALVD